MKQYNYTLLIFLFACSNGLAQSDSPQVFATSGGEGSSATQQTTWTIGEPIINTVSSASNVLTQGYQQPWLDIMNSTDDLAGADGTINIYPNPTRYILNIQYSNDGPLNDRLELMDAQGRLVHQGRVLDTLTELDMSTYTSGNYILRLSNDMGELRKTFNVNITR